MASFPLGASWILNTFVMSLDLSHFPTLVPQLVYVLPGGRYGNACHIADYLHTARLYRVYGGEGGVQRERGQKTVTAHATLQGNHIHFGRNVEKEFLLHVSLANLTLPQSSFISYLSGL